MAPESTGQNYRLAKNTLFLYFRMVLLLLINLYASRIILKILGIDDYGVFNVVGGVVTLLGFLNSTISSGTQRFLNIALGQKDYLRLRKYFSNALLMHCMLALIVLVLAETIGLWFIQNKIIIPSGRETAAFWVYQFSIVSIIANIIQLPFTVTIIAHEKMDIYAYISIFEGLLKLVIIYLLSIINYDKLILYGGLYTCSFIIVSYISIQYAWNKFEEARLRLSFDKAVFKEMLRFSGWNVLGGVAAAANNQGLNVVLNLFFGTTVNAARGIATQFANMLYQLVSNFQTALKPQIIGYYASGKIDEMIRLSFLSAKASAFLMMIVNVPIILEIKPILKLWLGDYPAYTPIFLYVLMLIPLIAPMTGTIMIVVQATGKLKEVTTCCSINQLLVLPISYLLLSFGCHPVTPFIVTGVSVLTEGFLYLYWMNYHIQYPIVKFYKDVYGPVFLIFAINIVVGLFLQSWFSSASEIIQIIVVVPTCILFSGLTIYYWGLEKPMRRKLVMLICQKIKISRHGSSR